jgi:hypothetical protein
VLKGPGMSAHEKPRPLVRRVPPGKRWLLILAYLRILEDDEKAGSIILVADYTPLLSRGHRTGAIGKKEGARRSMQRDCRGPGPYTPWPRTMASLCLPPSAAALNPDQEEEEEKKGPERLA